MIQGLLLFLMQIIIATKNGKVLVSETSNSNFVAQMELNTKNRSNLNSKTNNVKPNMPSNIENGQQSLLIENIYNDIKKNLKRFPFSPFRSKCD